DKQTEIGSLIHPNHLASVLEYVEVGKAEGAKLVAGGGRVPGMERGNYMQPTLFADVDNRMRIAQEEVFGPVLVVIPFDGEEEAVRIASDVKYGLAGYVWTQNVAKANRVAQGIQCGMVWVNSQNVRDLRTPFGGAKESGIGREGGHYSWEFYCDMKNIAIALGDNHIPKFGAAYHSAEYLNYTVQRPAGVAGLITPWNLPFMLTSWKVAPCLASGCTAVVKPASWTPLSNEKLAECIRDAGVPDGVFNLVYGAGETIGMGMVKSPDVQLISFTGETVTGKAIMREGAATMKRYSMELGGKSPIVVFADADYDRALDAAVFGVYSLNGERCTASSRCIVERPIYDRFVADLTARVNKIRVGDPMDTQTEIGSLIHPNHLASVLEYVEIGKREGAKLVAGGGRMPG
ncbi:MAG: aldehyde dehydrogenase family protein, partial [Thermomicrobia bacterium]|nr:aldehyde dehydrogenase family protein [Thermomicrobia bacterium]